MCKCNSCKYLFTDSSVGYYECKREDDFTDEEYEEVIEKENYDRCRFYEKEVDKFEIH